MALDITINLTDELEAILVVLKNEHNQQMMDSLSPAQFLRQFVRDHLRSQAGRLAEQQQLGLRAAYKLATPEEQAQIDAILDQY